MNHPLLHTTGRLSSRMDDTAVAKLLARVQPHLPQPADWNHPDIELEIGMGNGLAMLERAKAAPHRLFVGSEVYLNGLQVALNTISSWRAQRGHLTQIELSHEMASDRPRHDDISNIRLTNQDARDLLANIPPATLSRILIPFPDPWPKAKHHKRRIVQPELLAACARTLKPNGELWVVTDWPSYAYHAIAVMQSHKAFTMNGCDLEAVNCKPSARLETPLGPQLLATAPSWWVPTKYQEKAITAGRGVWYIKAIKRA